MHPTKLTACITLCAAIALLVTGCQNAPRYKKGNGRFDEWQGYQGKGFTPSSGKVTAVDPAANTITIETGKATRVFPITTETRIIHEDADIPLAKFPLNTPVKFRLSEDGKRLMSVWYGNRSFAFHRPGSAARAKSNTSL